MELIEDPVTVHYHLPNSLSVQVHREYDDFLRELISRFPHEEAGIRTFYAECWKVCSITPRFIARKMNEVPDSQKVPAATCLVENSKF
jgi:hypothetical protein